ncbi:DUF3800 domain-containing protein [Mesorhizobium sp. M0254]|uniref:DUF3800 domain-containing protein n=1 Tax=Mesorhizobium sp. M0254 TaxID=2956927 RepID=UPI00333D2F6E
MPHSFLVYIDESGDEGFTFRPYPNKGSSDWFVLTAVITPVYIDHEVKTTAQNIRQALGLPPKGTIHFADIAHDKRIRAFEEIASSNVTITSVIVNKREIANPAIFTAAPNRLYRYATRFLLERVSWHCRDFANVRHLPNSEAKLIFEHRRRLSYEDLKEYLRVLQVAAHADAFLQLLINDVRIHWPAINIDILEAAQKHDYAGLQLADCAASGIRWALEESRYGNTEHRYAKMLKPRVYSRGANYASYGMKCFPQEPEATAPNSHWLRKHYK